MAKSRSRKSLAELHPRLAAEWHPEKNGGLTPQNVTPGSGKRVWWRCSREPTHEWKAVIASRVIGRGCPMCAGHIATPTTSLRATHAALAAEWHSERNQPLTPDEVMPNSSKKVWWRCPTDPSHEWPATISSRVAGNGCPMCSGRSATPETSLEALHPAIATEWHPIKNGDFVPSKVQPGSNRKVWWQCSLDPSHEWEATIANRVKGSGCPICSGRIAIASTSLLAIRPELAIQWHPDKNGKLARHTVRPRSGKKVWWRCSVDPSHEWQATIASRAEGAGCPFCAGQLPTRSTSLRARHPSLADEWHSERNQPLTADEVMPNSTKKVWWQCSVDPSHVWEAVIGNRAAGNGCPMCSGRIATPTTSLKALYPQLAAEWHPDRNEPVSPDDVRPGSNKKVWWRCSVNPSHEWESTIVNRAKGRGCPCCAGQLVTPTTSLKALYPDVAREWCREKNCDLTPDEVRPGSHSRVWWRCAIDPSHEWEATTYNRVNGSGCPICSGRIATKGTSLMTLYPELIAEWDKEKNVDITPGDVKPKSNKKIWWRCSTDPTHEWQATVYTRVNGSGCPICTGRLVTPETSLEALNSVLAAQWHPNKNGDLTPDSVRPVSGQKVWWQCPVNPSHEWQATVAHRAYGRGCPFCTLAPRSRDEIILACELLAFLTFDPNDHKLLIGERILDVDILVPDLRLVVEFDGCYWHREKQKTDLNKTALLVQAGWQVIRAREKPLEALGPNDVVVPEGESKTVADLVLLKIQDVCGVNFAGHDAYLRTKSLVNVTKAEALIKELLVDRARVELDTDDPQQLLFSLDDD